MQSKGPQIVLVVGAILMVLCQVIIAPNITIGNATPNFLLAYCFAIAMLAPQKTVINFAFVLGLLYNLIGSGPVGAMAFCMLVVVFALVNLEKFMGGSTPTVNLTLIAIGCIICEILYGVFMLFFMSGLSLGDILILRALPCAIYDILLSALLYIIMNVLYGRSANSQGLTFR